ncbi:MAG: tyrosine--tRNA ligase [Euzebyales bacterium]|nr:tyrosine--tRNA ligase [Euzebyales bacterium]
MSEAAEHLRILTDGAVDVLPGDEFARKVTEAARGDRPPLRVKFGMDPSSPDVHIGHSVILRKLRAFQDLGHVAVLIIGGFTARVGDPSGRTATRPQLTEGEVAANATTYLAQVRTILRSERLEVVDNAAWLAGMGMADVLRLASSMTVARMLERADFSARYTGGKPIAISEFLYPLLQGQDSVEIGSDVELGGTDQTFNLLVGRELQRVAGQDAQCVLTMPLLEGLDGSAKMSKTAGNTIGVTDEPAEMFGKSMRLRDDLMVKYFRLATDLHPDEVDRIAAGLAAGSLHPGEAKRRLARTIVAAYHGEAAATAAEERFDTVHVAHRAPDDIPTFPLGGTDPWFLPALLRAAGLAASGSEARRMVSQGAVKLDGERLDDPTAELPAAGLAGRVLQVGRRRMRRLIGGRAPVQVEDGDGRWGG